MSRKFSNYIPVKHRQMLDSQLNPCPFCESVVRIIQSDGTDCAISRECRKGFYIKCWECELLFGYEPQRGGTYMGDQLRLLVSRWNTMPSYHRISKEGAEPK